VPTLKNAWSYTSTPQYAFMVWCSVKAQGQLYLYLTWYNLKPCWNGVWPPIQRNVHRNTRLLNSTSADTSKQTNKQTSIQTAHSHAPHSPVHRHEWCGFVNSSTRTNINSIVRCSKWSELNSHKQNVRTTLNEFISLHANNCTHKISD
jgi:hypothetical protein